MKITIYTVPDCPFSKQEKEYLRRHNLPFEERELGADKAHLTEMLAISNNFAGTPVTKIEKDDGKITVLKGFTKEEFDRELNLSSPEEVSPTPPADQPIAKKEVPSSVPAPTPPETPSPTPTTTPPPAPVVSPPQPVSQTETPSPAEKPPTEANLDDDPQVNDLLSQLKQKSSLPPTAPDSNPQPPTSSPPASPTANDQPGPTTPPAVQPPTPPQPSMIPPASPMPPSDTNNQPNPTSSTEPNPPNPLAGIDVPDFNSK